MLAKQYLCFLIHCLGLSELFFQGTSVLISWQQLLSAVSLQTPVPSPKGKVCPSEGCLGYWLWWYLLSFGGVERARHCQDQGRSHSWVCWLTHVRGGGGHARLCKSDTIVVPLSCSLNLPHRPIYREIMYWLYELLKYSFFKKLILSVFINSCFIMLC